MLNFGQSSGQNAAQVTPGHDRIEPKDAENIRKCTGLRAVQDVLEGDLILVREDHRDTATLHALLT